MSKARLGILRRREPLRIGFLPVSDSAPLIYASEVGLFQKYGLDVQLERQTRWTAVRDRIINGDLDAAQAPATLPFLANVGVESDPCSCVSGMVMSLEGNAITLSRRLWDEGVRDAGSLRAFIYKHWRKRTFTFGVVFPYSPAFLLLRQWLKEAGIDPESEVRIVNVPPEQMYPILKIGYIDGYCVGEPWCSLATQAGVGECVATSAELAPLHPEKVLMVRQSFAIGRADEHERLVAALIEACAFCDRSENRRLLGEMLAHPAYVNAPAECVSAGLSGKSDEAEVSFLSGLTVFHAHGANDPGEEKSSWLMTRLYEVLGQSPFKPAPDRAPVLKNVFRRDIYQRATTLVEQSGTAIAAPGSKRQTAQRGVSPATAGEISVAD